MKIKNRFKKMDSSKLFWICFVVCLLIIEMINAAQAFWTLSSFDHEADDVVSTVAAQCEHYKEQSGSAKPFSDMLTGFRLEHNAVAAISDGDIVLASNDTALIGLKVQQSDILSSISAAQTDDKLERIKSDGEIYYGKSAKYGEFNIYVIYEKTEVYGYHKMFTAYMLVIFLIFWIIMFIIQRVSDKRRVSELERQQNINTAIGRIFTAYYLIDLTDNSVQVLKGRNVYANKAETADAQTVLRMVINTIIAEDYRERAAKFLDFSNIDERIEKNEFLDETFYTTNDSWYFCSIIPKRVNADGKVVSIIMTIRDISTQTEKQLEFQQQVVAANNSLKETVTLLESLRNIYFSSIYVNIEEGTYKSVFIAPWLKRFVPDEGKYEGVIEALISSCVVEEDREMLRETLSADYAKYSLHKDNLSDVRQSYYVDYRALRNGTVNWCRATIVAVSHTEDGSLKYAWALLQDVDEEKNKEMAYQQKIIDTALEARQANAAKTEFLRRISHDIRTPINGILGMLNIADHYPDDIEKQKECREKIRSASGFLFDLVNDVLDMNKMESGEIIIENEPFDLKEMVNEIIAIVDAQAVERGVKFTSELCEPAHWHVVGSPLHIRQILLNIAGNGVKYNKKNGSMKLICKEKSFGGGEAVFEFTCIDTGIGISEEFQRHMFEPFAQEENDARTQFSGSGLGLSIVKKLLDKMHGEITVRSTKGEGSVFTVTIPFKAAAAAACAQRALPELIEDKPLSDTVILLVEDNELNMEIAEFILQNEGAKVIKAANGQEAVEQFKSSPSGYFDVILMDIMMPVLDGISAAKQIRSADRADAHTVPIIAMTANAFTDEIETYKKAGMNDYISKPVDKDIVIKMTAKYAGKKA